jgi:hypothetical protein
MFSCLGGQSTHGRSRVGHNFLVGFPNGPLVEREPTRIHCDSKSWQVRINSAKVVGRYALRLVSVGLLLVSVGLQLVSIGLLAGKELYSRANCQANCWPPSVLCNKHETAVM